MTNCTLGPGAGHQLHPGVDERVCRETWESPEFAGFLFFLVQSAKQMRYTWFTLARIYFGSNVFGPSKLHQGKCFIVNLAREWQYSDFVCFLAAHMNMLDADKPFMERVEWMVLGSRMYATYCPVTEKREAKKPYATLRALYA